MKFSFFLFQGQVSSPLNMAIQIGDQELAIKIIEEYQREIIPEGGNMRNTMPSIGRRVSRQIAMSNLGLASIIDQKNERGMSPMHIAAASGNKYVFLNFFIYFLGAFHNFEYCFLLFRFCQLLEAFLFQICSFFSI